jgi:hypothetical protein
MVSPLVVSEKAASSIVIYPAKEALVPVTIKLGDIVTTTISSRLSLRINDEGIAPHKLPSYFKETELTLNI